jgi:hypothetical protein
MDKYEFERKTLKHSVYWVPDLKVDVLKSQVYLALVAKPNTMSVAVTITFIECQNFSATHVDDEYCEMYMPIYLGIQNEPDELGTRYTITTDVAELIFVTPLEPVIDWIDKSALAFEWEPEVVIMPDDCETSSTE